MINHLFLTETLPAVEWHTLWVEEDVNNPVKKRRVKTRDGTYDSLKWAGS